MFKSGNRYSNKLETILREIASDNLVNLDDDFNPFEQYGGNFDDTFNGGIDTGRIELARELLEEFFNG